MPTRDYITSKKNGVQMCMTVLKSDSPERLLNQKMHVVKYSQDTVEKNQKKCTV